LEANHKIFDLIIIGSGPGGYLPAILSAQKGLLELKRSKRLSLPIPPSQRPSSMQPWILYEESISNFVKLPKEDNPDF